MLSRKHKIIIASIYTLVALPAVSCVDNKNRVEKMICQSADLSDLQHKLNTVFEAAIKKSETAEIEKLKREQSKWRSNRNQCKTVDCIHTQIMNRLTILDKYLKN